MTRWVIRPVQLFGVELLSGRGAPVGKANHRQRRGRRWQEWLVRCEKWSSFRRMRGGGQSLSAGSVRHSTRVNRACERQS
jgi:hypothetical protein